MENSSEIGTGLIKVRAEKEVGILMCLGSHKKFDAIVKERYSDFHVNEIDPNGQIVRLTSLAAPPPDEIEVVLNDPSTVQFIPEDIRDRISKLQNDIVQKKSEKGEYVEINVTQLSKDERTKIHKWLTNFDKLSSETIEKDEQKFIVVSSQKNSKFTRRSANRARYTHCVLYKEGVDTCTAISYIARKLQIKPNLITYAGTKDKQAKTTQRISISNIDASRLVTISEFSSISKLGNFEYQPKPIQLGDLKGNHFKTLLKNVICESEAVIEEAIESLKTTGFINYFGLQRFGSYEIGTHKIGKALIQMKWLQVFDLILAPKGNDADFMRKAKEMWISKRDANASLKHIPRHHSSIESNLLYGLSKYYHKKDFSSALHKVPRNVRSLYIHAFQSYIWNRIASYRIQAYGVKPVIGDLVLVQSEDASFESPDLSESGDTMDSAVASDESVYVKPQVMVLTDLNIKNYSIYDVVIPLQGSEVQYPRNKIKDYYEKILSEEGLKIDCFLKLPKSDATKGAYRKLLLLPKSVSYKIIPYSDSDCLDTFILSDLDDLKAKQTDVVRNDETMEITPEIKSPYNTQGKEDSSTVGKQESSTDDKSIESKLENSTEDSTMKSTEDSEMNIAGSEQENIGDKVEKKSETASSNGSTKMEEKNKKCVLIEFSLPSSAYATMALREIIRGETDNETEAVKRVAEANTEDADNLDLPVVKKPKLDSESIKGPLETVDV